MPNLVDKLENIKVQLTADLHPAMDEAIEDARTTFNTLQDVLSQNEMLK